LKSYPKAFAFCFKNPTSKFALCATITVSFWSPKNSKTFGKILSIVSASFTISSVIFVTSDTLSGICLSGFTKQLNSSITSLFLTFIIPISVILSFEAENPVVSKSSTQYVVSISWPFPSYIDFVLSGAKYASTP